MIAPDTIPRWLQVLAVGALVVAMWAPWEDRGTPFHVTLHADTTGLGLDSVTYFPDPLPKRLYRGETVVVIANFWADGEIVFADTARFRRTEDVR